MTKIAELCGARNNGTTFKLQLPHLTVRSEHMATGAFSIGLTVGVFLMVMALARGIDLTLTMQR